MISKNARANALTGASVSMESAFAGLISMEISAKTKVSILIYLTMDIEAVKTMTMTYILVCTVLILIIGALYYYRGKI